MIGFNGRDCDIRISDATVIACQITWNESVAYMKKVIVQFTYDVYTIEVPNQVAKSIRRHQEAFDKWLYDKNNDHGLWQIINGEKQAVAFGIEHFVAYLNDNVLRDCPEKVKIVKAEKARRQSLHLMRSKIYF